jgi:hypothetical protein
VLDDNGYLSLQLQKADGRKKKSLHLPAFKKVKTSCLK